MADIILEKIKEHPLFCVFLFIIIIAYAGFCKVIASMGEDFVFKAPSPTYGKSIRNYHELITKENEIIATVWFPNEKSTHTIIYCHGNANDLGTSSGMIKQLFDKGFSVIAIDYPGFGLSTGKSTEDGCYRAIYAAYDFLVEDKQISPDNIIAFGFSLGTGPATKLASDKPIAGLILQAPFLSIYNLVTNASLLPFDMFNNYGRIDDIKCPLLLFHGTADQVIPFEHGEKLFKKAKKYPQSTFISIQGGQHSGLQASPHFFDTIIKFSQSL